MINSAVISTTGLLIMILGFFMVIPGMVGLFQNEMVDTPLLLLAAAITIGVGVLMRVIAKPSSIAQQTGILTVVVGWIAVSLFGALPYIMTGRAEGVCNSIFESVSGFTTTGATIITDIEVVGGGLMLWRSMTHWIGGMGIILMVIIIFPSMEGTAMNLMQAESGLFTQRFKPRLRDTGVILVKIYVLITAAIIFFLLLGGMSFFDAVCHAFGTVATGGFSTKNASIAAYNSLYIEIVVTLFMFLSAINFANYFRLVRGDFTWVFRNTELRAFVLIILVATLVCAAALLVRAATEPDPVKAEAVAGDIAHAPSEVVCIISTTGFGTADINSWPDICKVVMILLMIIGGCCGSTCGALKVQRFVVAFKVVVREMRLILNPGRVIVIKMNGEPVADRTIRNAIILILLYLAILLVVACLLIALGEGMLTSFSISASCLGGVGPGFDKVASHCNDLPIAGKWILVVAMLIGRLEVLAFFLILAPATWKRARPRVHPGKVDKSWSQGETK